MRTRPPPRQKGVSAGGSRPLGTFKVDANINPASASENARLRLRRQAHSYSIGLVAVEKALPGQLWYRLRQVAERRAAA